MPSKASRTCYCQAGCVSQSLTSVPQQSRPTWLCVSQQDATVAVCSQCSLVTVIWLCTGIRIFVHIHVHTYMICIFFSYDIISQSQWGRHSAQPNYYYIHNITKQNITLHGCDILEAMGRNGKTSRSKWESFSLSSRLFHFVPIRHPTWATHRSNLGWLETTKSSQPPRAQMKKCETL